MSLDQSTVTSLIEHLHALRDDASRRYSLLERNFAAFEQIIEQPTRNYASAKQLYSTWDDPPVPPQILGQLLSTITDLG